MSDMFTSVKNAPTRETIVDFLNANARSYLSDPNLLDPYMGKDVKFKKKKVKEVALTPAQRAVKDFGGRCAVEKQDAGERMFYYWTPDDGSVDVRLAFFMADKSFRIVEARDE
jgi:hypothetical protein